MVYAARFCASGFAAAVIVAAACQPSRTVPIDHPTPQEYVGDTRISAVTLLSDSPIGLITDVRPDITREGAWLAGSRGIGYVRFDSGLEQFHPLQQVTYRGATRGNNRWIRWNSESTWKVISLEEPGWGLEGVAVYDPTSIQQNGAPEWRWRLPASESRGGPIDLVQPLRMSDGSICIAVRREFSGDTYILDAFGTLVEKTNWGHHNFSAEALRIGELGSRNQALLYGDDGDLVAPGPSGEVAWRIPMGHGVQFVNSIKRFDGRVETSGAIHLLVGGTEPLGGNNWNQHWAIATVEVPVRDSGIHLQSLSEAEADQASREQSSVLARLRRTDAGYTIECAKGDLRPPGFVGWSATLTIRAPDGSLIKRVALNDGPARENHLFKPRVFVAPHGSEPDQEDVLIAWGIVLYRVSAE